MNKNKALIFLFLPVVYFFALALTTKDVHAACDPPECGSGVIPGDCSDWGPTYRCSAKCCIPPEGGGGTSTPPPVSSCTTSYPKIERNAWGYPDNDKVSTFWIPGNGGIRHDVAASAKLSDIDLYCSVGTNCTFYAQNKLLSSS